MFSSCLSVRTLIRRDLVTWWNFLVVPWHVCSRHAWQVFPLKNSLVFHSNITSPLSASAHSGTSLVSTYWSLFPDSAMHTYIAVFSVEQFFSACNQEIPTTTKSLVREITNKFHLILSSILGRLWQIKTLRKLFYVLHLCLRYPHLNTEPSIIYTGWSKTEPGSPSLTHTCIIIISSQADRSILLTHVQSKQWSVLLLCSLISGSSDFEPNSPQAIPPLTIL